MKKTVALLLAASTLFLAGCCTTHQTTQRWEYKVTYCTSTDPDRFSPEREQQDLNDWAKEGWIFVAKDGLKWYLKRPVR